MPEDRKIIHGAEGATVEIAPGWPRSVEVEAAGFIMVLSLKQARGLHFALGETLKDLGDEARS